MQVNEKVESRLMSEMRQHLVEMNRKKMLDRGLITERELAIIGDFYHPPFSIKMLDGMLIIEGNWQSVMIVHHQPPPINHHH